MIKAIITLAVLCVCVHANANALRSTSDAPFTCADLQQSSSTLSVWAPLDSEFNVTASSVAQAFRLSSIINLDTIYMTVFFDSAAAAGCTSGNVSFDFGLLMCNGNQQVTSLSSAIGWSASADNTGIEQQSLASGLYSAQQNNYVWIMQASQDSFNRMYTTCNPYNVGVNITGTYNINCLNGGTVNIAAGACSCLANYTGVNCTYNGPCDPTAGSSQCTTSSGDDGMRTCNVNNNLQTSWGTCEGDNSTSSSSSSKIGISIGAVVGILIAVISVL